MHDVVHLSWGVAKHVATGYLLYSIAARARGRVPTPGSVLVALFAAMVPDLLDKPLTVVGVVAYGRSFGHSLITASAIVALVGLLARRRDRPELSVAFGVGYLSHVLVDMYGPLLTGSTTVDTAFLLWPVVTEYPLGVATPALPASRRAVFTAVLIGSAVLWLYDGMPVASDALRLFEERGDRR